MSDTAVRRFQIIALILLFAFVVSTVWRIGVMHTDDANWVVLAHRSPIAAAWGWATSQGRLYGVVIGSLMLHALRWEGTLYGELLKFGAFGGFIVMFGAVLRAYFGWRVAILSIGLFLGLHALRFEGSALTTYPLLVWPCAIGVAAAILSGRNFAMTGRSRWLLASGATLFASLFTNEGLTATFAALFGLFWLANWRLQLDPDPRRNFKRQLKLGFLMLGVLALYAGVGLVFLAMHPSQYEGHALAPFDLARILRVFLSFSTSGSVLHDFISPYAVTYSDHITASGARIVYTVADSLEGIDTALLPTLLSVVLVACCWTLLIGKGGQSSGAEQPKHLPAWAAIVPGLVFVAGPILPVALTSRYQHWHIDLGVDAYVTSVVSHFGLSIVLAGLAVGTSSALRRHRTGRHVLAVAIAVFVGIASFIGMRMNERIAWDMRLEGARWAAFERAIPFLESAGLAGKRIVMPQFAGGSWFSAVPESYWVDYAKYVLGRSVSVTYDALSAQDVNRGTVVLSYVMTGDRRSFDLIAANLVDKKGSGLFIDRIAVEMGRPTRSEIANAVLAYNDRRMGPRQAHVMTLSELESGLGRFVLDGADGEPGSIQLARQSMPGVPSVNCGVGTDPGIVVFFGTTPPGRGSASCRGAAMLDAGWAPPESTGVWTNSATAVLAIPVASLPESASSLTFDMNSYTGFGFTKGRQTLHLSLEGQPEQSWTFVTGEPAPQVTLPLPRELGNGSAVKIRLRIEDPIQPSSIGGGPDTRSLGIFLRSLRVD